MTKRRVFNILKRPMASKINFIEIYSSFNEIDANVIELLMRDYNINCSMRTLGFLRLATDLDELPEKRIAVEEDKVDRAKKIINEAIRNGVISDEGKFVS